MYTEVISIIQSLDLIKDGKNNIPPTMLYNEGWLLRLILNWFSLNRELKYKIQFSENAIWYSEALLSSIFAPRYRGDNLAESWTHADGVIGNFSIGNNGFGDLKLSKECKQFIVIEAKIFSRYSKGTKNAPDYNQVARNVACMCNIISDSQKDLDKFEEIKFYTFLPEEQIEKEKSFEKYIVKENIKSVVKKRIDSYNSRDDYNNKLNWYNRYFIKFVDKIQTGLVSWEEIIDFIVKNAPNYGIKLQLFYKNCLDYNKRIKIEEGAETTDNSE